MVLAEIGVEVEALRQRLGALTAPAAAPFGLNAAGWSLLQRARQAAPQPLSAARLAGWNPSVNPWIYEAGLQHLAAQGLLAPSAEGAYGLTATGEAAFARIAAEASQRLAALALPNTSDLPRLAEQLQLMVTTSLAAPEPPRQTRLRLSQRLAPAASAAALAQIAHALAGLAAYRADCHWAAWEPHMVSGLAWEALSALWRGTPGTVDDVYGRLAGLGWPHEAYARALQELVRQHWAAGPEPYTLTPVGRTVRERADAQAQRDYLAPWSALAGPERAELGAMLQWLSDALPSTP